MTATVLPFPTRTPPNNPNPANLLRRKRISLTAPQFKVATTKARFKVVVAGRRFGKTFLAGAALTEGCMNMGAGIYAYIAPTYRMAKRIAWSEFKAMVPQRRITDANESSLTIKFDSGAELCLFGADNPDSLRGIGIKRFVLDEYAMMDKRTWPEVIRPALSATRGDGMFIGTPAGFNHFHDLYTGAMDDQTGTWAAFQYTTLEGGNVRPGEIEAARRDMSPRQFRQEYMASFEALASRVYYAFDRKINVRPELVCDDSLPILVGIDFNIAPGMHAVVAQRVADQVHVIDELYIPNGNTEELAREVVRRYGVTSKGGVLRKRKLIAYPDPTGKRRQTNAPIGVTDHTILSEYGFEVLTPFAPYAVVDKINTTNAALQTAAGTTRLYIHPRCKLLIKGFDGLTYKDGTSEPDKSGGHDHITDGCAYLVCMELPMQYRVIANTGLDL